MRRFLFGLFFLVSLCYAADPIVVPGKLMGGIWTVEGTLSGKRAVFMIDSGANRTVMLPGPLFKEGEVVSKIQIGDFSTNSNVVVMPLHLLDWLDDEASKVTTGIKPIMVILGMDVLQNMAVGFDYDTKNISFWTGGKVDSKMAQGWAMEGAKRATPLKIDLARRLDIRLAISIAMGDSKGWLMFDTGTTFTSMMPGFGDNPTSFVLYMTEIVLGHLTEKDEMRAVAQADMGAFKVPWLQYQKGSAGSDVPGQPNGLFSLRDLRSKRVLADFAAASVYFANPDRNDSAATALTQMTALPFTYDGGELRLGAMDTEGLASLKAFESMPIVTIAGRPVKDVMDALLGTKADAVGFMQGLLTACRSDFVLQVKTKEGTTANIQIAVAK